MFYYINYKFSAREGLMEKIEIPFDKINVNQILDIAKKYEIVCNVDGDKKKIIIFAPKEIIEKILTEYNFSS